MPPTSPSSPCLCAANHILRVRVPLLLCSVCGWNGLCGGIRRLLNGVTLTVYSMYVLLLSTARKTARSVMSCP